MGTSVSVYSVCRCGSGAQVNHPGKGREKKSMCWLVVKSSVPGARLWNSPSLCSSSWGGKVLQIIKGLSNFFCLWTSSFPRTACLGCLNISARWELVWAGEFGISLEQSAFAISRLSSSIFHWPLEGEGKLEDFQCAVLKRVAGLLSSLFVGVSPQCKALWFVFWGEDSEWLQFPLGLAAVLARLSWKGDNAAASHSSVTACPLFNVSLCKDFCIFLEIADSHKWPKAQPFPAPCRGGNTFH